MRQNEYTILEPIITSHTNQSERDKKNELQFVERRGITNKINLNLNLTRTRESH